MDIRNLGWIVTLTAFSTLSCGDAVPPRAEGAASLALHTSATTTGSCPSHTLSLMSGLTPPSSTGMGDLLIDGKNDASVSCKVQKDDSYVISGELKHGTQSLSVSGTIASDGTGTFSLSFWDSVLFESLSDTTCQLTQSYTLDSGSIWASIRCTQLASRSNNSIECAAEATLVFKSCDE
jgi:hypothetical protein